MLNVLKSGYPKDEESFSENCKKEDCALENAFRSESCSCYSSAFLSEALEKGASHCKIDKKIKNLSFVFVASRKKMKLDQDSLTTQETFLAELENDRSENEKTLKDSSKKLFCFSSR